MMYHKLLNTKSLTVFILLFSFYLGSPEEVNAQKINQLTKEKKRTGVWKKYYSNNRIRYVGSFVNGKEVGVFKYYDITTSRHPVIIKEFSSTSDSAKVRYYNLDGKLRTKGTMLKKSRIGKWVYFFPNGTIFSEEFYTNGKLEGILKNYYKNGNILEITQYSRGMKNGVSEKFSDQEVLIEKVNYKNDILNGKGMYFELNGDLKEEGVYKDGKRIGKWEFYIGGKKVSKKEKKEGNKFNKNMINNN
ncbi:MAG: toxin-antitoxin system YwqK family antitoxin [Flavobacteriaceae bacterium]|nr:toxin-antitoxin system YwqK family antitoxin [Flavobacteriaceae bacterium]